MVNIEAREILGGSISLIIFFNLFNLFNFIYHLFMVRMLSVADYGAFVTIMAICALIGVPSEAVSNTITRFVTLNREPGKIKNIMNRAFRKFSIISFISFIVFLFVALPLSRLLGTGYFALALCGFVIFVVFFSPIPRGILLGEKKYVALGANIAFEGLLKLVLGVFFVFLVSYLGYSYLSIHGAVLGVVVGALIAFMFAFVPLKHISNSIEKKAEVKNIYIYIRPAFIVTFVVFAFASIDIVIARMLFDADTAGNYAVASTLGKIIFFVTGPISKAMFPLTSEESKHNRKSKKIFIYSGLLLFALITIGLLIFYSAPGLLIKLFSGKFLPMAEPVLFVVALSSAILAFVNLLLFYKLSVGMMKGWYLLIIFIAVEVFLLFNFSSSLLEFSYAFLASTIIFLISSAILVKYG